MLRSSSTRRPAEYRMASRTCRSADTRGPPARRGENRRRAPLASRQPRPRASDPAHRANGELPQAGRVGPRIVGGQSTDRLDREERDAVGPRTADRPSWHPASRRTVRTQLSTRIAPRTAARNPECQREPVRAGRPASGISGARPVLALGTEREPCEHEMVSAVPGKSRGSTAPSEVK